MDFSTTPSDFGSRGNSASSLQFIIATTFSALTVIIFVTTLASDHIRIAGLPLSNHPHHKSEADMRSALNLHRSLDLVFGKSVKNVFRNSEHREDDMYSSHQSKSLLPPWTNSQKLAGWTFNKKAPDQLSKMLHNRDDTYHSYERNIQNEPVSALSLNQGFNVFS